MNTYKIKGEDHYKCRQVKAQRDELLQACVITLEALRVMEPELPQNAVWSVVSETLETAIGRHNKQQTERRMTNERVQNSREKELL